MRYGKVSETIWTDDKFSKLSDMSKLLFIYLLSCPRCNSVGIFSMGLGTVEDEFGHSREEIRASIEELENSGLASYVSGWFWFNRFLKWNAPVSPNHARQIASVLNSCVMQNAPVEAICSFLGSVYSTLKPMTYKTSGGQNKSYWDEFRSILDVDNVQEYVGGEESFKSCLSGKSCPRSTTKGLDKTSASTSKNEVLPKDSNSTTEVLPKDLATQTRNIQETETYKTRQDKTQLVESCQSKADDQVSLICSDGQPHGVSQAAVLQEKAKHPFWDWEVINARFQSLTALDPSIRPNPTEVDTLFHEALRYFDGDRINLPQNQFSVRFGESTSPAKRNASEEAPEAYAER